MAVDGNTFKATATVHVVENGFLVHIHSNEYPHGANFIAANRGELIAAFDRLIIREDAKVAALRPVE